MLVLKFRAHYTYVLLLGGGDEEPTLLTTFSIPISFPQLLPPGWLGSAWGSTGWVSVWMAGAGLLGEEVQEGWVW